MKEVHNFKVGDVASVINYSSMTGKYYNEGEAKIIAVRPQEDMYMVEFHDGHKCERYVDPNQLDKPVQDIIDGMNTGQHKHRA